MLIAPPATEALPNFVELELKKLDEEDEPEPEPEPEHGGQRQEGECGRRPS